MLPYPKLLALCALLAGGASWVITAARRGNLEEPASVEAFVPMPWVRFFAALARFLSGRHAESAFGVVDVRGKGRGLGFMRRCGASRRRGW